MKILVISWVGFIGRHLVNERLVKGHEVVVYVFLHKSSEISLILS